MEDKAVQITPPGYSLLGDTLRAIAVLVRFPDDDYEHSYDSCWDATADITAPPVFADELFEPFPPGAINPAAFREQTLTAYYYKQSMLEGAPHFLFGDMWPKDASGNARVYEAQHGSTWYDSTGRGFSDLTEEVLNHLRDNTPISFADYDRNGDSIFDGIILIMRGFVNRNGTRYSENGQAGLQGSAYMTTNWLELNPSTTYDGISVDLSRSGWISMVGALCFDPQGAYKSAGVVRNLAHEHGHDLLGERTNSGAHRRAFGPSIFHGENGVPSNSAADGTPPTRLYDYLLMGGTFPSGIYTQGAPTMSVHERTTLGWLDPEPLTSDRQDVVVRDLYTYGDAFQIAVGSRTNTRTLFVSNRQRLSYFDSLATFDYPGAPPNANNWSLMENGLAIELSRYPGGDLLYYDYLFADNTYGGGSYSSAFQGDMHGPGSKAQITPWTIPNINGCAGYEPNVVCGQPDFTRTWQALDDIRYQGGADSTMLFDFYADYRDASIVYIREDSWMGEETGGSTFAGEVRVTNGATLTIEDGITLTFEEGLHIDDGARVETESGVTLKFDENEQLKVYGTLAASGTTFEASDTNVGWLGIAFEDGASGTLTGGTITAVAPPDCQGGACIVEPGFAVAVDDAEVTLRNLTIENDAGAGSAEGTYGVYATGSDAHVVLEEVTIEGLSGRGLAAVNHAQVRARDTQILNNDGDGIAVSSNAEVWMRQTQVGEVSASSGNSGRGGVTASGGHVRFGEPIAGPFLIIASQGYTAVSGNAGGGLLARTGTSIQAGSSRYHRYNTISENDAFQSKASGNGASLSVNADFWGLGNLPSVQTQGGATAFIEAYCTDAPVFDQGCTLGFIGAAPARQPGSQHAAGTRTSSTRSGATQGVSHSEGSDAPRATEATKALDRAADFYAEGQTSAAVAQLRTVVNRFAGMPEAAGALGTLGRWVPRLGAQDQRTALGVIEKETGHPVAAQRWAALAALSGARSALGQTEAALTAADALTADVEAADVEATAAADSDLHVVGPAARFWALFAGERYGEAEAAWASLAAVDAEHDETEAARLALSLATDRTASGLRAGDPRAGDLAAERGGQATSAATPGAAGLGRPYPNPTTGGVTVPLALDATAEVAVVVVDVLGRAVATLASGRLEAGHHALTLDTAALAPGVYVVRAEGLGAEGPGTAHTFTVVR